MNGRHQAQRIGQRQDQVEQHIRHRQILQDERGVAFARGLLGRFAPLDLELRPLRQPFDQVFDRVLRHRGGDAHRSRIGSRSGHAHEIRLILRLAVIARLVVFVGFVGFVRFVGILFLLDFHPGERFLNRPIGRGVIGEVV